MDNKISNIKERCLQIAEYKKIAKEIFAEKIGMTYGNFKGEAKKTPLNSTAVVNILSEYPDINPEWLLTGTGEMLRESFANNANNASIIQHAPHAIGIVQSKSIKGSFNHQKKENEQNADTRKQSHAIPLIPLDAVAGFGSDGYYQIQNSNIEDRYVVPDFDTLKPDYLIRVRGSSMYPKYNSGDIIACKIIDKNGFIQWNKPHVLDTEEQGVLVKRIKPSEQQNYWQLHSDNQDYPPFDINKTLVRSIALVVGVIRLE